MAIWLYVCLKVHLGVRVRGKVCHLRLLWLPDACQNALSLWQRGSGNSPPVTISVNTASKHTLCYTKQPGTRTASKVFNTVSSNIVQTEGNKRCRYQDKGLCSFTRQNKMAGDFAYYVLSTVGPYYSSSSNKASTEEKTLCHLLLCEQWTISRVSWTSLRRHRHSMGSSYADLSNA